MRAEEYFKRALKIREEQLGPSHSRVGQTLKHMITLYEMQEKFKEAIECGTRALTISENIFGSGKCFSSVARSERVDRTLRSCVMCPDHLLVAAIQLRLGLIYGNTDNPHNDKAMALEMLNKALKIRQKKHGSDHKLVKETEHAIHAIEHPEDFAASWDVQSDEDNTRKKMALPKPIAATTTYSDRMSLTIFVSYHFNCADRKCYCSGL